MWVIIDLLNNPFIYSLYGFYWFRYNPNHDYI